MTDLNVPGAGEDPLFQPPRPEDVQKEPLFPGFVGPKEYYVAAGSSPAPGILPDRRIPKLRFDLEVIDDLYPVNDQGAPIQNEYQELMIERMGRDRYQRAAINLQRVLQLGKTQSIEDMTPDERELNEEYEAALRDTFKQVQQDRVARDKGVLEITADITAQAAADVFANVPAGLYNLGLMGLEAMGMEDVPYAPYVEGRPLLDAVFGDEEGSFSERYAKASKEFSRSVAEMEGGTAAYYMVGSMAEKIASMFIDPGKGAGKFRYLAQGYQFQALRELSKGAVQRAGPVIAASRFGQQGAQQISRIATWASSKPGGRAMQRIVGRVFSDDSLANAAAFGGMAFARDSYDPMTGEMMSFGDRVAHGMISGAMMLGFEGTMATGAEIAARLGNGPGFVRAAREWWKGKGGRPAGPRHADDLVFEDQAVREFSLAGAPGWEPSAWKQAYGRAMGTLFDAGAATALDYRQMQPLIEAAMSGDAKAISTALLTVGGSALGVWTMAGHGALKFAPFQRATAASLQRNPLPGLQQAGWNKSAKGESYYFNGAPWLNFRWDDTTRMWQPSRQLESWAGITRDTPDVLRAVRVATFRELARSRAMEAKFGIESAPTVKVDGTKVLFGEDLAVPATEYVIRNDTLWERPFGGEGEWTKVPDVERATIDVSPETEKAAAQLAVLMREQGMDPNLAEAMAQVVQVADNLPDAQVLSRSLTEIINDPEFTMTEARELAFEAFLGRAAGTMDDARLQKQLGEIRESQRQYIEQWANRQEVPPEVMSRADGFARTAASEPMPEGLEVKGTDPVSQSPIIQVDPDAPFIGVTDTLIDQSRLSKALAAIPRGEQALPIAEMTEEGMLAVVSNPESFIAARVLGQPIDVIVKGADKMLAAQPTKVGKQVLDQLRQLRQQTGDENREFGLWFDIAGGKMRVTRGERGSTYILPPDAPVLSENAIKAHTHPWHPNRSRPVSRADFRHSSGRTEFVVTAKGFWMYSGPESGGRIPSQGATWKKVKANVGSYEDELRAAVPGLSEEAVRQAVRLMNVNVRANRNVSYRDFLNDLGGQKTSELRALSADDKAKLAPALEKLEGRVYRDLEDGFIESLTGTDAQARKLTDEQASVVIEAALAKGEMLSFDDANAVIDGSPFAKDIPDAGFVNRNAVVGIGGAAAAALSWDTINSAMAAKYLGVGIDLTIAGSLLPVLSKYFAMPIWERIDGTSAVAGQLKPLLRDAITEQKKIRGEMSMYQIAALDLVNQAPFDLKRAMFSTKGKIAAGLAIGIGAGVAGPIGALVATPLTVLARSLMRLKSDEGRRALKVATQELGMPVWHTTGDRIGVREGVTYGVSPNLLFLDGWIEGAQENGVFKAGDYEYQGQTYRLTDAGAEILTAEKQVTYNMAAQAEFAKVLIQRTVDVEGPDGKLVKETIWTPFVADIADDRLPRVMTPEFRGIMVEGPNSPAWEPIAEAIADVNQMDKAVVLKSMDAIYRVTMEMEAPHEVARDIRFWPDWIEANGQKVQMWETRPFEAMAVVPNRVANRLGFYKKFGSRLSLEELRSYGLDPADYYRPGRAVLDAHNADPNVRLDSSGPSGESVTAGGRTTQMVMRAMHGLPADLNQMRMLRGVVDPTRTGGTGFANRLGVVYQAWSSVIKSALLSRAFIPNLPEPFGNLAVATGQLRVIPEVAKAYAKFALFPDTFLKRAEELRNKGIVTEEVPNLRSYRAKDVITLRDKSRALANIFRVLALPQKLVNEMNDIISAEVAIRFVDDLKAGNSTFFDVERLRTLGFDQEQAERMIAQRGTEQEYQNLVYEIRGRTQGTRESGEQSQLMASDWFRTTTAFNSYGAATFDIGRNIVNMVKEDGLNLKDAKFWRRGAFAATATGYKLGAAAASTAGALMLAYGVAGPAMYFYGFMDEVEEDGFPEETLTDLTAMAWFGGIASALPELVGSDDQNKYMNAVQRAIFPASTFMEINDAVRVQGRYDDVGGPFDGLLKFMLNMTPLVKDLRTFSSDREMAAAIRGYYTWMRRNTDQGQHFGGGEDTVEKIAYQEARKAIVENIRKGTDLTDPVYVEQIQKAMRVKAAPRVADALRSKRLLEGSSQFGQLDPEQKADLVQYLEKAGLLEKLLEHDAKLEALADAITSR